VKVVPNCTRCGGFIIPEAFRDIGIATIGWHCLLCGETVDDVILQNRARPLLISPMDEEPSDGQDLDENGDLVVSEEGYFESV
jgi:hypothetical protein